MKSRLSQERLLARLARERGIDDDYAHHVVLYALRLLDDDDDYALFCQMQREDLERELEPSPAGWDGKRRLSEGNDPPTIAQMLAWAEEVAGQMRAFARN